MNQEKIGRFIRELRIEKNMTQSELANKLGVTDKAVSKWENGRGLPDYVVLKELCEELNITFNEFISGEKIKKEKYQDKLEENIVLLVIDNKKLKRFVKSMFKLLVIIISIFLLGVIIYCYIANYVNLTIDYNKDTMTCSFENNELQFTTAGNVAITNRYERIIDNKLYIIFHSYVNILDNKNNDINNKLEKDSGYSLFQKDFTKTSYDDVIVYYSKNNIDKYKNINDKEFISSLNNMNYMCSLKKDNNVINNKEEKYSVKGVYNYIISYFQNNKNEFNIAYNYVDESKNIVIVGLVDISKDKQNEFMKKIFKDDTEYINYIKKNKLIEFKESKAIVDAQIVEIKENTIAVVALNDSESFKKDDKIIVGITDIKTSLSKGNHVRITYNGMILYSNPAQIEAVKIEKIK